MSTDVCFAGRPRKQLRKRVAQRERDEPSPVLVAMEHPHSCMSILPQDVIVHILGRSQVGHSVFDAAWTRLQCRSPRRFAV